MSFSRSHLLQLFAKLVKLWKQNSLDALFDARFQQRLRLGLPILRRHREVVFILIIRRAKFFHHNLPLHLVFILRRIRRDADDAAPLRREAQVKASKLFTSLARAHARVSLEFRQFRHRRSTLAHRDVEIDADEQAFDAFSRPLHHVSFLSSSSSFVRRQCAFDARSERGASRTHLPVPTVDVRAVASLVDDPSAVALAPLRHRARVGLALERRRRRGRRAREPRYVTTLKDYPRPKPSPAKSWL